MNELRHTPCGDIRGTACQWPGVTAFKGIRYATAGRWEYPRPVTKWPGVYDATRYGNCSYQPRAFYDERQMPEKAFYYNEFRKGETYTYSEDCLFLNIWTPEDAAPGSNLPVLFYIHGGALTGGCGHEKHFDGPVWPAKGVIAVTINYRLGPLGFACLPELEQEAGHTGNYALYDQLTALQWVARNIQAFGGDPKRITIMGQSAGAMAVEHLCLTPLSEGLIAGAVMSSGGGVGEAFNAPVTTAQMAPFWQAVMQTAGCETLAQFRALPPETLFAAWQTVCRENKPNNGCVPCVDGQFLPEPALALADSGRFANVPYLLGSTSEDIVPPIVHCMAKSWCRRQYDQGKQPSYAWFFDRRLPGDDNGAWHSSDLWYWFGTLDHCWRPMTEKDRQLSGQMTDYLTNFARTGDPNGEGLPRWLPVAEGQDLVLRLGEQPTHMGDVDMAQLEYTMRTNHAVGE